MNNTVKEIKAIFEALVENKWQEAELQQALKEESSSQASASTDQEAGVSKRQVQLKQLQQARLQRTHLMREGARMIVRLKAQKTRIRLVRGQQEAIHEQKRKLLELKMAELARLKEIKYGQVDDMLRNKGMLREMKAMKQVLSGGELAQSDSETQAGEDVAMLEAGSKEGGDQVEASSVETFEERSPKVEFKEQFTDEATFADFEKIVDDGPSGNQGAGSPSEDWQTHSYQGSVQGEEDFGHFGMNLDDDEETKKFMTLLESENAFSKDWLKKLEDSLSASSKEGQPKFDFDIAEFEKEAETRLKEEAAKREGFVAKHSELEKQKQEEATQAEKEAEMLAKMKNLGEAMEQGMKTHLTKASDALKEFVD